MTLKGQQLLAWGIDRLTNHSYDGGLNGTCYECPFASDPMESDGSPLDWRNTDQTEAYFRCSLPTRAPRKLEWGEYAPCNEEEWKDWLRAMPSRVRVYKERHDDDRELVWVTVRTYSYPNGNTAGIASKTWEEAMRNAHILLTWSPLGVHDEQF